jgi:hypothetical protein
MESSTSEVKGSTLAKNFSISTTTSQKDTDIARRAGWVIVDYTVPESIRDRSYHVAQCDGVYGQHHYGIIKDLNSSCVICKVMTAHREKNCVQHVYVEGRKTFELVCDRGHHYLASAHKKGVGRCPMCIIEDECKSRGRVIYFDSECIYVNPDSRLRYYCQSCTSDHYITYAKWMNLFSNTGKKRKTQRSIIGWCQHNKHSIQDNAFVSILNALCIFEQLFDMRFDDCDDMIAANNKFLSGIYFTGYNRKLKLAFVHTLDPFYSRDNIPLINWCKLRDITLICIDVKPRDGYDMVLSKVCSGIIKLHVPTRFDSLINGDPPDGTNLEFYRITKLMACMLIEGQLALKPRVQCIKKA